MQVSIKHNKDGSEKVRVKIDSGDLWDGDATLAKVIYPFLKKYRSLYDKESSWAGYPPEFGADPTKEEGPDNPDRFQEWLQCLDKMVYSFEWLAKNNDWDGPERKNYRKACDAILKPHRNELKKLKKQDDLRFAALDENGALNSLEFDRHSEITRPLFKEYYPKFEAHRLKVQEGIDLFARYFKHLWV